jgi:hypothetical protein
MKTIALTTAAVAVAAGAAAFGLFIGLQHADTAATRGSVAEVTGHSAATSATLEAQPYNPFGKLAGVPEAGFRPYGYVSVPQSIAISASLPSEPSDPAERAAYEANIARASH